MTKFLSKRRGARSLRTGQTPQLCVQYLWNTIKSASTRRLIVGDAELRLATPTYPEICIHSLQDLEIIHSRPKLPFTVDAEKQRKV
jgi:hypothetical protein